MIRDYQNIYWVFPSARRCMPVILKSFFLSCRPERNQASYKNQTNKKPKPQLKQNKKTMERKQHRREGFRKVQRWGCRGRGRWGALRVWPACFCPRKFGFSGQSKLCSQGWSSGIFCCSEVNENIQTLLDKGAQVNKVLGRGQCGHRQHPEQSVWALRAGSQEVNCSPMKSVPVKSGHYFTNTSGESQARAQWCVCHTLDDSSLRNVG